LIAATILVSTAAAAQAPFYNQGRWRGGGDQGAAIIGGMIGGAIGSMFAPRPYYQPPAPAYYPPPQPYYQPPQYSDAQMYCMQRFRSYDPRSGYFTGYDNRLHPCP
jgi:hypothetical protein